MVPTLRQQARRYLATRTLRPILSLLLVVRTMRIHWLGPALLRSQPALAPVLMVITQRAGICMLVAIGPQMAPLTCMKMSEIPLEKKREVHRYMLLAPIALLSVVRGRMRAPPCLLRTLETKVWLLRWRRRPLYLLARFRGNPVALSEVFAENSTMPRCLRPRSTLRAKSRDVAAIVDLEENTTRRARDCAT